MENSFRFFCNSDCKYLPCHEAEDGEPFNCLFCYCPLYPLGENCGGNFKISGADKIKNCEDCLLPHRPDYYDAVMKKLVDAHKESVRIKPPAELEATRGPFE